MNYRYVLLFSALIFAQGCPAMLPQDPAFQRITSWQDMAPFAAKIVAFYAPGNGWNSNLGFTYQNENEDFAGDFYFAYVAPETNRFYAFGQEPGYFIYPLISLNKEFELNRLPYNIHASSIENRGNITMRLATPSEINQIGELIDLGEAKFQFLPDSAQEAVRAILKQYSLAKL